MCVIFGDIPNSGYMLRFTQEHACLRISTKPVDMPEDSPQTPHCCVRNQQVQVLAAALLVLLLYD